MENQCIMERTTEDDIYNILDDLDEERNNREDVRMCEYQYEHDGYDTRYVWYLYGVNYYNHLGNICL